MKTSPEGIRFIMKFEELRLRKYKCPAGIWTIGYGHTMAPIPTSITTAQAKQYLIEDVNRCEIVLNSYNLQLKQHEYDALISFIFNVGASNFKNSTVLKYLLEHRSSEDICFQIKRWRYSHRKVIEGLERRRYEEVQLYSAGDYNISSLSDYRKGLA